MKNIQSLESRVLFATGAMDTTVMTNSPKMNPSHLRVIVPHSFCCTLMCRRTYRPFEYDSIIEGFVSVCALRLLSVRLAVGVRIGEFLGVG